MVLDIKIYPDKILRRKAKIVGQIDGGIKKLIDNMVETLHSNRGLGLAANQVGEAKRIAVVDDGKDLLILINPKITNKKGKVIALEGCLSLPGCEFEIKRPEKITVKYLNKCGLEQKLKASGLLARIICHEVDHLEGKTLLDKLNFFKRLKIKRLLKQERKS